MSPFLTGGSCPDGWHSNGSSCYKYFHEVTGNRWDAGSRCYEIGSRSYLVYVDSEIEQKFLESIG